MFSRKPLLTVLTVLALSLATATPAVAGPAPTDLVGTLELVLGEDFETGAVTYDYHLQTARGRVAVKFAEAAPDGFVNGAVVRIRGRRDGVTLVAADGATGGQVLASAPGWTGQRKLAVILLNFSNNATKPFSRAYASGVVFTNANSVRAYYAEQSHGAMVLQGATFDWVKVPYSSSTCQPGEWASAAKAALTARGVDFSSYTNFMYMFPNTSACKWGGLGHLPGRSSWINGTPSLRVSAHELGHNLGIHHASSLRCTKDGVRVALSSTCTKGEYGDPFTTMGAAKTRHVSNLSLVQIGYLPQVATRTIVASGSYSLVSASSGSGVRILAIPRGDGSFLYLEYRRPYGTYFDNFSSTSAAVKGVTIRIAKGWTTITQSLLIDAVPSTTTFTDAPLRLGRTFRDYRSGASIYVSGLGTTTAKVTIKLPADVVAPTAVGAFTAAATSTTAIALAWTAASDNRAVAGYRVWRDGLLIATTAPTVTRSSDASLAPGTTHTYAVRAFDSAGNQSAAAVATATTRSPDPAPTAPGNLAASVGATTARLTWSAATDNVAVSGYRIWRDGALSGSTTGLSFSTVGLTPETTYTWTVRAYDNTGQLGAPANVTARTPFVDVTPPSSPVALISQINLQRANLTWSAATDNVGVATYLIYRDGELLATVGAGERTVRVPATGGYTVVAVDAAGNRGVASGVVRL